MNRTIRWHSASDSYLKATAFLVVLIAAYATRNPPLMLACVLLAACLVLANLRVMADASVREKNAAILFVVILTVMLPLSVLRGETALLHYVVSISVLGAAFVLTRNVAAYVTASRLVLVAAQLAVLAYLLRTGITGFPLDDILPNSSSNGVTSYMVLLQANYCVGNYLLRRRASLPTAAVTLFICIVGWGRGSILAAAALIVIGLFFKIPGRNHLSALLRVLLLLGSGLVVYLAYSSAISEVVAGTKIGSGLYDESRLGMIREYLDGIDAATLWAGGSYSGTSIASEYNGNPHNSFIRAHYIFGLPYLLAILLLPVYMVRKTLPVSVKLYAASMWLIVLFRSFTEPILFPTLFDYFYFSICFVLSREAALDEPGLRPATPVCNQSGYTTTTSI